MSLSITESIAVCTIARALGVAAKHDDIGAPTEDEAREALAVLADGSYKRLGAGIRRIDVENASPLKLTKARR
jgi:hypothetical protein